MSWLWDESKVAQKVTRVDKKNLLTGMPMSCGEVEAIARHTAALFTEHTATFEGKETENLCSPSAGVSWGDKGCFAARRAV